MNLGRCAPGSLLGCLLALAACATPPAATDAEATAEFRQAHDPLEPANRFVYGVNDRLDNAVVKPVATEYRDAVPPGVRTAVSNVLSNLGTPLRLTNDILQAKPRRAGDTTMRFLINSTVGVAGLFDVATGWGYPAHGTDFGITLGIWGVGEGPFLEVPLTGPNDVRDATGYVAGFGLGLLIDPFSYVGRGDAIRAIDYAKAGVGAVSARERLLDPVSQIKRTALDPYATFRSLYRQHRRALIAATEQDDRATLPDWWDR